MSNQFHVGGGYLSIGGKFDSRNRYIRQVANIADKTLNMVRGPSLSFNYANTGSSGVGAICWAWSCNATSVAGRDTNATTYNVPVPSGFNTGVNTQI
jgi:hypothetical protein